MDQRSNRRFSGYRTDSKHGIFGTLTLWNLLGIVMVFVLGQEFAKRVTAQSPLQTLIALGLALLTFVLIIVVRRMLAAYPKIVTHWWRFWSGEDLNVVKPDRRPVPLVPPTKGEE